MKPHKQTVTKYVVKISLSPYTNTKQNKTNSYVICSNARAVERKRSLPVAIGNKTRMKAHIARINNISFDFDPHPRTKRHVSWGRFKTSASPETRGNIIAKSCSDWHLIAKPKRRNSNLQDGNDQQQQQQQWVESC